MKNMMLRNTLNVLADKSTYWTLIFTSTMPDEVEEDVEEAPDLDREETVTATENSVGAVAAVVVVLLVLLVTSRDLASVEMKNNR